MVCFIYLYLFNLNYHIFVFIQDDDYEDVHEIINHALEQLQKKYTVP